MKEDESGKPLSFCAVILAAGKGTRMKSDRPKVLHPLLGRPMVWHVLQSVRAAGAQRIIVVVGHQADLVQEALADAGVEFVLQQPQMGTGHAVMQAEPLLRREEGTVLVTYGDTPLLTPETLRNLVEYHTRQGAAATVLSAHLDDPTGYGRIVRNPKGAFQAIVEEKDAGPSQRAIREINTGTYCFQAPDLLQALAQLRPDNAQSEYYLTDTLGILARERTVLAAPIAQGAEWQGINSRAELARAEAALQAAVLERWAQAGVTIHQPSTVRVEVDVRLEPDCTVGPYVLLRGHTLVERGAVVGPRVTLTDVRVGRGARVEGVDLVRTVLEPGAQVGPGVALPSGTVVGSAGRVGRLN